MCIQPNPARSCTVSSSFRLATSPCHPMPCQMQMLYALYGLDRNAPSFPRAALSSSHVQKQCSHPSWIFFRFHGYLSMAAYGDYKKLCPRTFTKGFTVLASYDAPGKPVGQSFYIARIPEMDKIVSWLPDTGLDTRLLLLLPGN